MCARATLALHPLQGCTGQLTTVEVERFNGNLPPISAFDPMYLARSTAATAAFERWNIVARRKRCGSPNS
jgi:hypothetical protein